MYCTLGYSYTATHVVTQVVNALLRGWLAYASSTTPVAPPLITGQPESLAEVEVPKATTSILGELQATEWHVLDEQGTFEPMSGVRQSEGRRGELDGSLGEASALTDAVDHVGVRLIHSPPTSPISFVQAALETVMTTVSGPK